MLGNALDRYVQCYDSFNKDECNLLKDDYIIDSTRYNTQLDVNHCEYSKTAVNLTKGEELFDDLSHYIVFNSLDSSNINNTFIEELPQCTERTKLPELSAGTGSAEGNEILNEAERMEAVKQPDGGLLFPNSNNLLWSEEEGGTSRLLCEKGIPSSDSGHVLYDKGINSSDSGKYVWKPGFCLQLGSRGRRAMLQLLRNTYKSNKKFKRIFESKSPPTTISNLPFFKVSMLWELANDLNVFDEAILIHKCFGTTNVRSEKRHCPRNKKVQTFKDHGNDLAIVEGSRPVDITLDLQEDGNIDYGNICGQRLPNVEGKSRRLEITKFYDEYEEEDEEEGEDKHFQLSTSPSSLSTEVPSINGDELILSELNIPQVENGPFYSLSCCREYDITSINCPGFHTLRDYINTRTTKSDKEHSKAIEFGKLAVYLSREYKFLNRCK